MTIADMDFADDIPVVCKNIEHAQQTLMRLEQEAVRVGLIISTDKTKFIHINGSNDGIILASAGTSLKKVNDFKYLGSYINTKHDIDCRL